MEAYATVEDLEARWRALDPSEQARASVLLDDASAMLKRAMDASGIAVDAENDAFMQSLKAVCCSMVRRAMSTPIDGPTVSNTSQTAGPFSQSFTYSNPSGDLYMTSGEKRQLGIGRMRIGSIPARIAPYGIEESDD